MRTVAVLTCKHLYPRRGVRYGQKVHCEVCEAERTVVAIAEATA